MKVVNIAELKPLLKAITDLIPGDFEVIVTQEDHKRGPSIVVRLGPVTVNLKVDVLKVWPSDKIRIDLDTGETSGELSRETGYKRWP